MDNHFIYRYTSPSGKSYIGQTYGDDIQRGLQRRAQNGNGYKGCIKFYHAIKRYGWDNFTVEILECHLSQEQANEREQYYIQLYDSVNNGYNITLGGGGTNRGKNSHSKDYLKEYKSGYERTPERKERHKQMFTNWINSIPPDQYKEYIKRKQERSRKWYQEHKETLKKKRASTSGSS